MLPDFKRVMKPKSTQKKGRREDIDTRQVLKKLYVWLKTDKYPLTFGWKDEAKLEFWIKYVLLKDPAVGKSSKYWKPFEAMDRINPDKYARYRESEKYDTESKKRFRSNIQKLCIDKCLQDLKEIKNFKKSPKDKNKNVSSYRMYHYKFLKIPRWSLDDIDINDDENEVIMNDDCSSVPDNHVQIDGCVLLVKASDGNIWILPTVPAVEECTKKSIMSVPFSVPPGDMGTRVSASFSALPGDMRTGVSVPFSAPSGDMETEVSVPFSAPPGDMGTEVSVPFSAPPEDMGTSVSVPFSAPPGDMETGVSVPFSAPSGDMETEVSVPFSAPPEDMGTSVSVSFSAPPGDMGTGVSVPFSAPSGEPGDMNELDISFLELEKENLNFEYFDDINFLESKLGSESLVKDSNTSQLIKGNPMWNQNQIQPDISLYDDFSEQFEAERC